MKSDFILERELSYKIYGIFLKVGKEYGTFQKELLYHRAIEEELLANNLNFVSCPKIELFSKATQNKIGFFVPDIVVEDKIIIEVKAVRSLLESYAAQLIKYLKFSKFEIGYLVNFGTLYTQIIRKIYTNDKK